MRYLFLGKEYNCFNYDYWRDFRVRLGRRDYENTQQVVSRIKDLLKPEAGNGNSEYSEERRAEFAILSAWMRDQRFYIKELPDAFNSNYDLYKVGNQMIRSNIINQTGDMGVVRWADRRTYVDNLTFVIGTPGVSFGDDPSLKNRVDNVLLGATEFKALSDDEKLRELANLIEYMLYVPKGSKGTYQKIPDNLFLGYIDVEQVARFRTSQQMFRHSSQRSVEERQSLSAKDKKYLVNLGITLIDRINDYIIENPN
ncbi:hypothetical protein [Weissella confusa]|uniref:hypothetical protein n=1 Tax=Weissella confusa TaxID=1583 RepID=UPI0022E152D7|nr:hypothetical protein [Weissella confusa]